MLTENVWVEWELVNGAMGTLKDIVWEPSANPLDMGPPFALLIEFDERCHAVIRRAYETVKEEITDISNRNILRDIAN